MFERLVEFLSSNYKSGVKAAKRGSKESSNVVLYNTDYKEAYKIAQEWAASENAVLRNWRVEDWKRENIIERLKKELESDSTERLHMEGRILSNFTKHQNITELTRELLVELVDKIIIYEDDKVQIVFQFADEFKKIKEIIDFELSESL